MKPRWTITILLSLLCVPEALPAQAVSGSLDGRVLSTQHEPLDGAAVTVGGPSLQGTRAVTVDAGGRFAFLGLPPGTYTLAVRRLGFAAVRLTGVSVRLGSRTSVGDIALASQAVEVAPVEVSAARPALDPLTAAAATPLDSSFFQVLATRRDFAPLAELAPLAAPSPFDSVNGRYLGATIGGASELENAYYIDGVDVSGIGEYAIAERGLPFNFVRDIQVLTGGYEAEYGRALGGVVNVVTNSGGNDFRGQLLAFYSGNGLRAAPRWGYNQTQIRSFAAWDVGVSLSGPIKRDRLWYYVAYNPAYAAAAVGFSGLASQVDHSIRHLFAAKLTWRADERTDVVLTVLGDPSVHRMVSPAMWGMPEQVANADAVLSRETSGGVTTAVRLRRQQGRLLLEASLARTDNRGSHFPLATYQSFRALATVYDYITNTTSGNSGIDTWARVQRSAAQATATFETERHTLKAGADYEESRALYVPRWSQIRRTSDPVYPYTWLTIDERLEGWNRVGSLYVQDSWAATPRLRINAGVRWDGQWLGGINGFVAVIANAVAPRLGIVLQPAAEGRSKVTASWGRFYQQIPAFSAAFWGGTGYYRLNGYRWDPVTRYTAGTTLGYFEPGGTVDAHLRGQYHDEVTVGYERRLGAGLKLGARGIARSLRWTLDDATVGADGGFVIGNPGRGALAGRPSATREYRALELTLERSGAGPVAFLASYVLSRNRGNYAGLFEEDMPTAGGGGNASVGYDTPEPNAVSDGLLPNDRTHLFKFAGSYRVGAVATVGGTFLAASGTPRSELGQSVWGAPYVVFVRPRGSLGRTPWIWDLNLRGTWLLPTRGGFRPRLVLDLFHVGSPRRAIWYDDLHYNSSQDDTGAWTSSNPNYGRVLAYQQPMSARLGMLIDF